jgi:hypothetical protein
MTRKRHLPTDSAMSSLTSMRSLRYETALLFRRRFDEMSV